MSIPLFLQGLIIGFSIAAPVGPIGILCIRRTLTEGRASGFFSGMGAATADAFYGCVAGFGLTVISAFLIEQRFWLQVVGGIFLCYLGARTLWSQPATESGPGRGKRASRQLCLHVFPDDHEPDDDPVVCRHFRRPRGGRRRR